MLLIAAWQIPHYRKIALEYTMDEKTVSIESLVKELQKNQLLTAHLNQSGRTDRPARGGGGEGMPMFMQQLLRIVGSNFAINFKKAHVPEDLIAPTATRRTLARPLSQNPRNNPRSSKPGCPRKLCHEERNRRPLALPKALKKRER
jgi:hypothetical protein